MSVDLPAPGGPVKPMTTDVAGVPARASRTSVSAFGFRSIWLSSLARWERLPAMADVSSACVVGSLIAFTWFRSDARQHLQYQPAVSLAGKPLPAMLAAVWRRAAESYHLQKWVGRGVLLELFLWL